MGFLQEARENHVKKKVEEGERREAEGARGEERGRRGRRRRHEGGDAGALTKKLADFRASDAQASSRLRTSEETAPAAAADQQPKAGTRRAAPTGGMSISPAVVGLLTALADAAGEGDPDVPTAAAAPYSAATGCLNTLRSKMKQQALKECDFFCSKYAECARGRTFSVVWQCRKQAKELNACLHQFTNDEVLEEMKKAYVVEQENKEKNQ